MSRVVVVVDTFEPEQRTRMQDINQLNPRGPRIELHDTYPTEIVSQSMYFPMTSMYLNMLTVCLERSGKIFCPIFCTLAPLRFDATEESLNRGNSPFFLSEGGMSCLTSNMCSARNQSFPVFGS